MRFTPPGTPTDPCGGVFNESLQVIPVSYRETNTSLFVLSVGLWGLSWVLCALLRNRPELRVARPLYMNSVAVLSNLVLSVALCLNGAVAMPCSVLATAFIFACGGIELHMYMILYVFYIESYFAGIAKVLTGFHAFVHADNGEMKGKAVVRGSTMHITNSRAVQVARKSMYRFFAQHSDRGQEAAENMLAREEFGGGHIESHWQQMRSRMYSFVRLLFGQCDLDDIPLDDFIYLRRSSYLALTLTILGFAIVVIVAYMGVAPVYWPANGCMSCPLYIDLLLAFISLFVAYTIFNVSLLLRIHKDRHEDAFGIIRNMRYTVYMAAPVCTVAIVLAVVDPGDREQSRSFLYFEWIIQLYMLTGYWWCMIGKSVADACWAIYRTRALQNDNSVYNTNQSMSTNVSTSPPAGLTTATGLLVEMDRDPLVKAEFVTYVTQRYAAENCYFCDDVVLYKRLVSNNTASFALVVKALRYMIVTYIMPDAMLEINISGPTRSKILKDHAFVWRPDAAIQPMERESGNHVQWALVFDDALVQIVRDVLLNLWNGFILTRQT